MSRALLATARAAASPEAAIEYTRRHRAAAVRELMQFVRFPSVSAQPAHAPDVARCAEWLAEHLRRIGLQRVRVKATPRHPLVTAEYRGPADAPTVLIYGHYDVQPADPLHEWRHPPFQPVVSGMNLHGRGACDDKGQLFTHVKAIEAYLRTHGELPVSVKCLFEGEEEIGSPNLRAYVRAHGEDLRADTALMSDTRMLGPDRPALAYSLRGALSLELEVSGPQHDLHSGNFGGAVHDPLQALCEIMASLHDACGRVAIRGFYENVRAASGEERAYMASHGPSNQEILRDAGSERDWGEPGYSLYERTTLRPSLTINGITGGYQGPGVKAVIPAHAAAKLNFRLVPDQDPAEIDRLFRAHVRNVCPPTVRAKITTLLAAKPAIVNRRHPAMRAAKIAYRRGFGRAPVLVRSSGTIPVVNLFQELPGIPTVLMGFALPDDRIHAPNEKFHLPNLFRGINTSIWFLDALKGAFA